MNIKKIIRQQETEVFKFKPNNYFYKKVGINSKRWAKIYRGEIDPTTKEVQSIADYFNIPISKLFENPKVKENG